MKRAYLIAGAATAIIVSTAGWTIAQQGMQGGMDRGHGPAFDFEELDMDGDGQITKDEMEGQAAARFGSADTDGDGKLSADEMAGHMRARMLERMTHRAEQMIARQDGDGDGMLSFEEMRTGRMGRMFERHDEDGDGAISAGEFAAIGEMRRGSISEGRKGHGERHGMMKGHGGKRHGGYGSHHGGEVHYHTHHHYYGGAGDAGKPRDKAD